MALLQTPESEVIFTYPKLAPEEQNATARIWRVVPTKQDKGFGSITIKLNVYFYFSWFVHATGVN